MNATLSKTMIRNRATLLGVALLLSVAARATDFTWNLTTPPGTYSWSTAANWDLGAGYPKTSSDLAVISNQLPSGWDTGYYTLNIDAPDITGGILALTDQDTYSSTKPTAVQIHVQVQEDTSFDQIDWYNDPNGNGRSRLAISAGKTLRVNTINMTGRFPDYWGWTGTLRFAPDGGGAATYNYEGGTEQLGGGCAYDHQDVTTMTYNHNGNGAYLEGRDCSWIVGNASADQTWNVTNGQLRLVDRDAGSAWNFVKIGDNDVDMGYRAGSSDGVFIDRNGSADFGSLKSSYYLFTDASGNPMGGTVKIARYRWLETGNAGTNAMSYDKLGTNLTVTTDGFSINDATVADRNDVTMFWVTAGRTLLAEGATSGDITISDISTNSVGRLGINFAGATVDADDDLSLTGPNTFLYDGGDTASAIRVGGDLLVQSRNPTGFSAISGLPTGGTAAWDDFDVRATTLTLDGGSTSTVTWDTGAPASGKGDLDVSDFSQANFALGTLRISNSTAATLADGGQLYLDDLVIDSGSTLTLGAGSMLYILDTTGTDWARISGYYGTSLLGAIGLAQIPGVGYITIPEPFSAATLGLCGLLFLRRRGARQV